MKAAILKVTKATWFKVLVFLAATFLLVMALTDVFNWYSCQAQGNYPCYLQGNQMSIPTEETIKMSPEEKAVKAIVFFGLGVGLAFVVYRKNKQFTQQEKE